MRNITSSLVQSFIISFLARKSKFGQNVISGKRIPISLSPKDVSMSVANGWLKYLNTALPPHHVNNEIKIRTNRNLMNLFDLYIFFFLLGFYINNAIHTQPVY